MMPAKTCTQRKIRFSHSLMVGFSLTVKSAIRRVAIGAQQERHVVMLRVVTNLKYDGHLREKAFDVECREIGFGIEHQPISARAQWLFNQEKWFYSAIFIGPRVRKLSPALIGIL